MTHTRTTSRVRRRALAGFLLIGLILAGAGWLFLGRTPAANGAEVLLVVSGDTQGWITPCGCTANQSGGLPRRAARLGELRRQTTVLYADAGGAIDGTTAYHAAKLSAILRGEARMGIVAHNLGAAEIALGAAALREQAGATGAPLLSTNAANASDGAPLVERLRIVPAAGLRVAFAGVLAPRFATATVRVGSPRDAVLEATRTHKGEYDRLVVLAYMSESELEALARELPEADAIVGGPTGQSVLPYRVGPTVVASATRQGKFIVEIPLTAGAGQGHITELDGRFADDAGQMANVETYVAELGRRDFGASMTGLALAGGKSESAFAGAASCVSCHQEDSAAWNLSGHAQAWAALRAKGRQVDPSCQLCHVTGYGLPGGFESMAATPARVGVSCENCHGPAQEHAKNPKVHTPYLARAQCLSCHDQENSPAFSYATYWAKIQHGARPAATAPKESGQ